MRAHQLLTALAWLLSPSLVQAIPATAAMKHVVRWLFGSIFAGTVMHAAAAPTPVFTGGRLGGFESVSVDGSLYSVSFVDGTCVEVFTGCDNNNEDFQFVSDQGFAILALMEALRTGVYGPQNLIGCAVPQLVCNIYMPYNRLSNSNVQANYVGSAVNGFVERNGITGALPANLDTSSADAVVYAVWRPIISAKSVPEPASLPLALLAGFILFFSLSKKNNLSS